MLPVDKHRVSEQQAKQSHDVTKSDGKESILVLNPATVSELLPRITRNYTIVPKEALDSLSTSEKAHILAVITGRGGISLEAAVLDELPSLKVVGVVGSSVKKYNPEALLKRNIPIINVSEVYAEAVAEFTLMLAILGVRKASLSHETMRKGGWGIGEDNWSGKISKWLRKMASKYLPQFLKPSVKFMATSWWGPSVTKRATGGGHGGDSNFTGTTFGIIGYGAISRCLIELLKPFDCKVKVYSNYLTDTEAETMGIEKSDLANVLSCKVVSIHRGLSDRTRQSLGRLEISMMKPGSVLINTARGEILDTEALIERLKKNDIFACLDVFEEEPLGSNSILKRLPNVFLTSHISGSTDQLYENASTALVGKVMAYLDGKPVEGIISTEEFLANMT
jgi:phosphoglycerate dehydrogenase-like enzyme